MSGYDDELRHRLAMMGERIRVARLSADLSQEQLAVAADLHRTYVGSVERGERNVSVGNLYRLAEALAVDPGSLL